MDLDQYRNGEEGDGERSQPFIRDALLKGSLLITHLKYFSKEMNLLMMK